MDSLTRRQAEILNYLIESTEAQGMPPTRMDIAETFGFRSPNAAEEHLRALARKGYIEMIPGASRGIRILATANGDPLEAGLPVIGRVAAGSPIMAQEHVLKHCQVAPEFFSPTADYLLQVQGLSMKDAGILEGDLLAVHKTTEARNGQIVVARIGDEVTVKRFQRDKRKPIVHLLPENNDFEPIVVNTNSDDFTIEGLAVGIIRQSL